MAQSLIDAFLAYSREQGVDQWKGRYDGPNCPAMLCASLYQLMPQKQSFAVYGVVDGHVKGVICKYHSPESIREKFEELDKQEGGWAMACVGKCMILSPGYEIYSYNLNVPKERNWSADIQRQFACVHFVNHLTDDVLG